MLPSSAALKSAFAKNRTEELGQDVWQHFVVPTFFDKLDLDAAKKPRVFIGGRGCGKTMLLRYLSHQTVFSRDRHSIPADSLHHIGLYWRADTQFARLMMSRGVSEDGWISAFTHFLTLTVAIDLLSSLESIAASSFQGFTDANLLALNFDSLKPFDAIFAGSAEALAKALKAKLIELELWVANTKKKQEPVFLSPSLVKEMITTLAKQSKSFRSAAFYVYLDEYENLLTYQQRIVNTLLKHSESPLIINLAMKRNAFQTRATMGDEAIMDIADYREHDLEEYLTGDAFDILAAEVLFLTLSVAGFESDAIDVKLLRSPSELERRKTTEYRDSLLEKVRQMLPGISHENLARRIVSEPTLARKVKDRLERALKDRGSTLDPGRFFHSEFAAATVTCTALLHRPSLSPEDVDKDFQQLLAGVDNRFTGKTGWIHNNLIGCILAIYESYAKACPFYSGFDAFCGLSRSNLRHFLELCHKSFSNISLPTQKAPVVISSAEQAEAARQVSAAFLDEVRSFGRLGNTLHAFVLKLGSLFSLAHRRPTQSEPEQSHFSITKGTGNLADEDMDVLAEAVKWSVLFEEKGTKVKDPMKPHSSDFVLNPIYAPYFNITYRKIRKLEITVDDFAVLARGTFADASTLLKKYSKQWKVEAETLNPTLFANMLEEAT